MMLLQKLNIQKFEEKFLAKSDFGICGLAKRNSVMKTLVWTVNYNMNTDQYVIIKSLVFSTVKL